MHNPGWDFIQTIPLGRYGKYSMFADDYTAAYRDDFVAKYCWALPDPHAMDTIAQWACNRTSGRVVEMGAGSGYWSYVLAQHTGVDIVAYDHAPVGTNGTWFPKLENPWYPVKEGTVDVLGEVDNFDRSLLMVWPNYNTSFGADCVEAYQGHTIFYVGEENGCTGDDKLDSLLFSSGQWNLTDREPIAQWEGIHDSLFVFTRTA